MSAGKRLILLRLRRLGTGCDVAPRSASPNWGKLAYMSIETQAIALHALGLYLALGGIFSLVLLCVSLLENSWRGVLLSLVTPVLWPVSLWLLGREMNR